MKIIGITGGVGSGKSMVLEYLHERYGVPVIQADLVGHEVMEPGFPRMTGSAASLGTAFWMRTAGLTGRSWEGSYLLIRLGFRFSTVSYIRK